MNQHQLQLLRANLGHQLTASRKLIDFAYSLVSGVDIEAKRKDLIFLALADKCFVSTSAIQVLCEKGFVDDGLALVRVLIEAVVNAGYILESGDQVADDFAEYPQFLAWETFMGMRAVDPVLTQDRSDAAAEELKKASQTVELRYAKNRNRDWTNDNLFERAKKLDTAAGFTLFRSLINTAWRRASAYVHSTADSLKSRLSEDDKHVNIKRVPTEEEAAGVLYICNMAVLALLALVDIRLGKKRAEDWNRLHREWVGE